jgi:tripartite-type tricarboxylate transporter receptor subunit TctC
MTMTRRAFTLLATIALMGATQASAKDYPLRPITFLVPFAAGGPVDTLARTIATPMSKTLGQPIIVENLPGGAGSIAVGKVAKAAPDGYTLSIGHWATHVINGAIYPLQYDLIKDFEPLGMIATNPMLIVASSKVPAANFAELVAWLKAGSGKTSMGTAGVGSATHIGGLSFQKETGTSVEFIPYKGSAPALQDLLAGHIQIMVDQPSNSLPFVRKGDIKAYAVTAKQRLQSAPDIPTVEEIGYPGLQVSVWYGLWAPKGTPKDVVVRINDALRAALADPLVRKHLGDLGQELPTAEQTTPAGHGAFHRAEVDKWWPIIKAANIKVE